MGTRQATHAKVRVEDPTNRVLCLPDYTVSANFARVPMSSGTTKVSVEVRTVPAAPASSLV